MSGSNGGLTRGATGGPTGTYAVSEGARGRATPTGRPSAASPVATAPTGGRRGSGGVEGTFAETSAWPIHQALVRPQLTMGVERPVIAVEWTLALALVVGLGPGLLSLGVVALVTAVIHPTMVWLTARDPQTTAVYVRSRRYADYYAPHAPLHARPRRPAPSVVSH